MEEAGFMDVCRWLKAVGTFATFTRLPPVFATQPQLLVVVQFGKAHSSSLCLASSPPYFDFGKS